MSQTNDRYQVCRGGPRHWYVQEVATGELQALPFATKKAAQAAVDGRNLPRGEK